MPGPARSEMPLAAARPVKPSGWPGRSRTPPSTRSARPSPGPPPLPARARCSPVAGFAALPGAGVRGVVDGHEVTVGSPRLFAELSLTVPPSLRQAVRAAEEAGRTAVLAGWDGQARAVLVVADQLKPHAAEAVARVRGLGLRPVLLTGDNGRAARSVAAQLGIPAADVCAEVRPEGKVEAVRRLQSAGERGRPGR